MDSLFEKEALELAEQMDYFLPARAGTHVIAESLRAVAERAWWEGARSPLSLRPKNPYTKPTEGER